MSKTSHRPTERIEQILQGLLKYLKKEPNVETFRVPLKEFLNWGSLLSDRDGLEIAFAKINSETTAVSFKFERVQSGRMMTASEGVVSDGYDVVKVHVEDVDGVMDYVEGLKGGVLIKGPINSLVFFEPEHGTKLQVVVNNDYKNIIKVGGKVWRKLFRIAKGEKLSARENKDVKDYFNSNENCKLYTELGYSLTKVLESEDDVLMKSIPVLDFKTIKALKRKINAA